MQSKMDDIAILLYKSVVCPYLNTVYISWLCLNFVGWATAVLPYTLLNRSAGNVSLQENFH